jgi:N-acyl-D-aspartate/D-glutamate deacylase
MRRFILCAGNSAGARRPGVTNGTIGGTLGAAKESAADGLALAPGIIDGHTHTTARSPGILRRSPPALGVTTAVMGNCFTIAPVPPTATTMRHPTHVEGMRSALRAGIRQLRGFPQYLDMLQGQGVGPNVAASPVIRHPHLRDGRSDGAHGDRRGDRPDGGQVREALAAGVGFASSTAEAHNGEGGTPMPSRWPTTAARARWSRRWPEGMASTC